MSSQGANSPGTATQDSSNGGGVSWGTSYDNIKVNDNTYANCTTSFNSTTFYLKATNFGFTIPSGATIDGIVVEIERRNIRSSPYVVKDIEVKIVKSNNSYGSTNKADTVNNWETSDTYKSYGGATDKWGETWAYTDINNSNFGVVLSVSLIADKSSSSYPQVDHVRCTVYYTEAVSYTLKTRNGLARASIKTINGLAIASLKERNGLT